MNTNKHSISDFYENDHDRLDEIFQEYLNFRQKDWSRATERFEAFKSNLQRHFIWEEEILFPLYEEKIGNNQGPTPLMREEHKTIQELLERIHANIHSHKLCNRREEQTLLIALGQHHLKEEYAIYPALDRLLTSEEKTLLFQKMRNTSRDHPECKCTDPETLTQDENSFPLIWSGK